MGLVTYQATVTLTCEDAADYAVLKERAQNYVPSEGEPAQTELVCDDQARTISYALTRQHDGP